MSSNPVARRIVEFRITVQCDLAVGGSRERWDILSVIDDSTGEPIGDIGIYDFDAYSDFVGTIADAVRDVYFEGVLVDTDVLYSLEISIRGGGSEIGTSMRLFWGRHPCAPP